MSNYKRLTKKDWHEAKFSRVSEYEPSDRVVLKQLWDLENDLESGKIIRLPCAIGSTIYLVPSETQFRLNNIGESFKKNNRVYEMEVYQIYMNKNDYVLYNFEKTASALGTSFGETWFLTKAEAEQKLKELEGEV